ncbi:hypothetical protein WJ60_06430 [Burkholderia ubonensis]|nr:hypothetical protein WJ60_06430 [Burkholderia ubonensis]
MGDDGQTYAAFDYSAGVPGLRGIIQYRYRVNDGTWSAWQPWNEPAVALPEIVPTTDSTSVTLDARLGFIAGPGRANGHWRSTNRITASAYADGQSAVTSQFTTAPVDIVAATGTMSSALVELGSDTALGTLTTLGSHTPSQPYRFALSHGPSGFGNLHYELDASPIVRSGSGGEETVAPDSASTASGIGLRIVNSSGNAIAFGQPYRLTRATRPANAADDVDYAIPFSAAWYRTGALSEGYARANVTVTVTYP